MRHHFDTAGNLVITASNPDRASIADLLHRHGSDTALCDALEFLTCNSDINFIRPEDVAALTDSPILAECSLNDDGTRDVYGRVWFFPDYMIRDPAAEMATRGRVVFTLAK